jgi:5'-3' exonuclease
MSNLLLIDGLNTFRRAWHSQNGLVNSRGVGVGGLYGFAKILRAVVNDNPGYTPVIAWDGGHDRRTRIFPEYKAGRIEYKQEEAYAEEDEYVDRMRQLDLCRKLAKWLGLTVVRVAGTEADDIIAYCVRHKFKDSKAMIVSTDKDFYQLLIHPGTAVERGHLEPYPLDAEALVEEHDHTPLQYRLFHFICGDGTDEVTNVPGVGPETAWEVISYLREDQLRPLDLSYLVTRCYESSNWRARKLAKHWQIVLRNMHVLDLLDVAHPTCASTGPFSRSMWAPQERTMETYHQTGVKMRLARWYDGDW